MSRLMSRGNDTSVEASLNRPISEKVAKCREKKVKKNKDILCESELYFKKKS